MNEMKNAVESTLPLGRPGGENGLLEDEPIEEYNKENRGYMAKPKSTIGFHQKANIQTSGIPKEGKKGTSLFKETAAEDFPGGPVVQISPPIAMD